MEIAFPIFDGITPLDLIGPFEVLGRLPGAEVKLVANERGENRTVGASLALVADYTFDDVTAPDILVVPGGLGADDAAKDAAMTDWVRAVHQTTQWTTSVCTGSLILGGAGLLDGLRATTHWRAMDRLAAFGATPVRERVVEEGKIVTAAGVSSGIDMALMLAARVADDETAKAIQLAIEYAPEPPFDGGDFKTAPEARQSFAATGLNRP
jgi:transcriptional regulator GlxA family with amidase domain